VSVATEARGSALDAVREQFGLAIAATKCHGCGCMLHTVEALEKAAPAVLELGPILDDARRVMTEIRNRGTHDVLIAVVDGLKGFPEAINAVFPDALVQVS
jgi:hypothetical protein